MAFQSTCEHWRLSGCLFGHPLFRVQAWPWAFPSPSVGAAMMSCSRAWAGPAGPWPASYHRATSVSAPEGDQLKSPSVQGSAGIALQHGLGVGCGIMARRGPATVCLWGWGPWGLMVVPITTLITRFPSPCLSHTLHAGRELF